MLNRALATVLCTVDLIFQKCSAHLSFLTLSSANRALAPVLCTFGRQLSQLGNFHSSRPATAETETLLRRENRLLRPRVFSPVNSHASELLHFANWWWVVDTIAVVDMMMGMLTMTGVRNSDFFPTCQVRVVRFYQSCCPPPPPPPPPPPVSPRPCLHQLPPPLPPFQLFAKLFANFRAQCALLDLNLGPSQLSAHRWTSTWDLPSSVRTAGPQTGTFPAQCAPLDLNLGPSPLSAHRRTSTWDLPSAVRTAGPQPGTFRAQCAPLDLNGQIKCQIECQKICQIECQIECQKICQIVCQKICQIECQIKCQIECQKICQIKCENVCQIECQIGCQKICQKICQIECQKICQNICQKICQVKCQKICQIDRMPEDMSDRMPEDLPVTTRINVMVGMTRSKVILN